MWNQEPKLYRRDQEEDINQGEIKIVIEKQERIIKEQKNNLKNIYQPSLLVLQPTHFNSNEQNSGTTLQESHYRFLNAPSFTLFYKSEKQFTFEQSALYKKSQKEQQKVAVIVSPPPLQKNVSVPILCEGKLFKKSQILPRWEERYLRIADNQIFSYETTNDFDNFQSKFSIGLVELNKMKLLSDCYQEDNFIFKLYYQKKTLFAADLSNYHGLPLCFAWFASILILKLRLLDREKFVEPQKINQELYTEFTYKKLISGYIYKKSQILGHWQKRLIIINSTGLYSFKDPEQTKPSFIIKAEEIKYIWTRFHFQDNFLIIKIKHNFVKTELAVPLMNFLLRQNNWLLSLYRLMIKHRCDWIQKSIY